MEYVIFALIGALCMAVAVGTIWCALPTKILGDLEQGLAALGKAKDKDEEAESQGA